MIELHSPYEVEWLDRIAGLSDDEHQDIKERKNTQKKMNTYLKANACAAAFIYFAHKYNRYCRG